jgi:hypothetical protein
MDGFRVYRADGSVQIDSSSLGFLFADDFYLGAGQTSTRTLTGAAGQVAQVVATGVSSASSLATISQANSGADLLVTVTSQKDGYFKIILTGGPTGTFGIQWSNTSGQLCVSSSQAGYVYLGNATFTGVNQPDTYSHIGGSVGGAYGYYRGVKDPFYAYQISSAYAPVAAVQLASPGSSFLVCSIRLVSTNLWEIVVGGNNWASPPPVKCFARMAGYGSSGYGIKLFDATGIRTWDSNENMMLVQQVIDWPAAYTTTSNGILQTMGHGVPSPYLLSLAPAQISGNYAVRNGAYYDTTEYCTGYSGNSSVIYRDSRGVTCDKYKDDFGASSDQVPVDRTYIINGNLYP